MTNISASLVKELRDKTGAGMMDCKAALTETKGHIEEAVDWLRKKGLSKAANKAGRIAAEGLIGVTAKDKAGAVVEGNSASDVVGRHGACSHHGRGTRPRADRARARGLYRAGQGLRQVARDRRQDGGRPVTQGILPAGGADAANLPGRRRRRQGNGRTGGQGGREKG